MSRQIEDGELCPSCNEIPIAFYGHDRAECPNCGERVVRSVSTDAEDHETDEDDDEFIDEDFDEDI
jgi:hypothetical protein